MKKHFVEFLSPGTFVSETTVKPIKKWDVDEAVKMARGIKERHGATPYGFRFFTRERGAGDLDSKVVKTGGIYFLGGKILTLAQVKARKKAGDGILISNMECNKIERVIENTNSWRVTLPFRDEDTLLEFTP